MPTVIILPGNDLDQFYDQTMQYLLEKYHTYPDVLPDIPLSEQQITELGAYECLAAELASSQSSHNWRLNFNRDPRYSNGLRRRRLR